MIFFPVRKFSHDLKMAGPFFWVPKNSVYIIDFGHSYQHLLTKEDKCSM